MARNRMIKTDFWDDEKLATISRDSRLTFIALWNLSDDYGVVKGNSVWLKNHIFSYDEKLKLAEFETWLNELIDIKVIYTFNSNSEKYYYIKNFLEHQKINRPSTKRNPEPPDNILEDSLHPHEFLTTSSLPKEKEKEKENIPEQKTSSGQSELIISIPLVDKTGYSIYQTDISEWQDAFPAVDIIQTLKRIRLWNKDNSKRRKTKKGIRKHITTWLEKEQNKGGHVNRSSNSVADHNMNVAGRFLKKEGVI